MEDNKKKVSLHHFSPTRRLRVHGQNEFLGIHVNIAVSLSLPSTVEKYTPEVKKAKGLK